MLDDMQLFDLSLTVLRRCK